MIISCQSSYFTGCFLMFMLFITGNPETIVYVHREFLSRCIEFVVIFLAILSCFLLLFQCCIPMDWKFQNKEANVRKMKCFSLQNRCRDLNLQYANSILEFLLFSLPKKKQMNTHCWWISISLTNGKSILPSQNRNRS